MAKLPQVFGYSALAREADVSPETVRYWLLRGWIVPQLMRSDGTPLFDERGRREVLRLARERQRCRREAVPA